MRNLKRLIFFVVVVLIACVALLVATVIVALLAGSLWLRLGDIALWIQHTAPDLVARALDERSARIAAAVLAGAALALAGVAVQGTVRNPLADERQVNGLVYLAHQVFGGYQRFKCHHLQLMLVGAWFFKHRPL